jgi:hypothetical protein
MEDDVYNWGMATPEAYSSVRRNALHVLNVNFAGEENRTRVIRFVCARIIHFNRHLPKGTKQTVRFDFVGQFVSDKSLMIARQIIEEESRRNGISVSVEFLTD